MTTVTDSPRTTITTRYIGPSNTRGSRIHVWRGDTSWAADPNRLVVPYNHALSITGNHVAATAAYVDKAGWNEPHGRWVVGNGTSGMTHAVWVSDR